MFLVVQMGVISDIYMFPLSSLLDLAHEKVSLIVVECRNLVINV